MNLTSAQKLTRDIENKNKRHILLTLLLSAIVMQILSFAAVRSLHRSTLKSLLESQHTAIAFQEWRSVRNGILSGWIWWPEIKTICLFHDGVEVLGESSCPSDNLREQIAGSTVSQSLAGLEIKASLRMSQWIMATGLSMLALLPLTVFGFVLRVPIKRRTQAQFLTFLSRARLSAASENPIDEFEKAVQSETEELVRLRNEAALALVARQVAHDIRSPLSALNMVLGSMKDEVPEKKRLIIRSAAQRINDIANNLLSKRTGSSEEAKPTQSIQMLSSLVDSIVSEKRTQFRDQMNVQIQVDLSEGYGLFAKIDPVEVARIISNLVNNSVEALENRAGKVSLSVVHKENSALVIIEDNAGGIAPEIIQKIGEKGVSFGKSGGSGLGLHHARQAMAAMGGSLRVESTPSQGTKISLTWPATPPPAWFINKLVVGKRQIVSIDDDDTIHMVWKERFKNLVPLENQRLFSSPEQFLTWYESNRPPVQDTLFLVDYEFLNHREKGLDLVEQLGIARSSVLVTSQFDEPMIRSRAEKLGVRILPKNLAQFIPLSIA